MAVTVNKVNYKCVCSMFSRWRLSMLMRPKREPGKADWKNKIAGSAEDERSFSALSKIKSLMWNHTIDEPLSKLSLMHLHQDVSNEWYQTKFLVFMLDHNASVVSTSNMAATICHLNLSVLASNHQLLNVCHEKTEENLLRLFPDYRHWLLRDLLRQHVGWRLIFPAVVISVVTQGFGATGSRLYTRCCDGINAEKCDTTGSGL